MKYYKVCKRLGDWWRRLVMGESGEVKVSADIIEIVFRWDGQISHMFHSSH